MNDRTLYSSDCSNYDKLERISHLYGGVFEKTLRANWLMLLNTILMGVVVVVGAYAPRYRRHPITGVFFLGATTLFLPIFSTIASTIDSVRNFIHAFEDEDVCSESGHLFLVFLWTGVVLVIGINASAVVAGDAREGRNAGPSTKLLIQTVWIAYLAFSSVALVHNEAQMVALVQMFAIMSAKMLFIYTAFYKARRSFALGRSPRLIVGYMSQLRQPVVVHEHDEHTTPPPPALIVMGEDEVQVEQQPYGYSLKQMISMPSQEQGDTSNKLLTLDQVWGLSNDDDDMNVPQNNQMTTAPHKDLCFSFALFKLLRCRFAKYTVSEAGFIKTSKFFRETMLQDEQHYCRVFGVMADELSFASGYYYSSLPIYYSHPFLPALGIALSLWSISYCIYLIALLITHGFEHGAARYSHGQMTCHAKSLCDSGETSEVWTVEGNLYYDTVPLYLVIAVLLLAETRGIVSYLCSNWTRVMLIYYHVKQASRWQRFRVVQKCIGSMLRYHSSCSSKLVNNWDGKMKQCSILELRPRKTPVLLHRLQHLLNRGKKVEVPSAVKAAIFEALKGESFTTHTQMNGGGQWHIRPPSPPLSVSLYACNGRRPAYSILVWHIATTIFDMRQPLQPSDDHMTVATHLSLYCAHLVTSCPELLPDDAEWCRGLSNEVKKDADRVLRLAEEKGAVEYHRLVQALSADTSHEVLRHGASLGKEMVDVGMEWEALAGFWLEMMLYVAPSENLEGHAEAISHGGELITLLWALLAHAGIVGRLDADACAAMPYHC